jgi:hypothetical protein
MPPKDKKEKPKEKPAGWNFDPLEAFIILLFLSAVLVAIVTAVLRLFSGGGLSDVSFYGFKLSGLINFFKSNLQFFKALGFVIAGGAAIGTFSFTKMADAIWRVEKAKLYPENMTWVSPDEKPVPNEQMNRWQKIVKLSESENQSDWRLSIIEADIMLDELLEKLQLPGETMGEKLKAVEPSDFLTIESAWEAHKARNMIAHNGSDFLVNQREVRRIISLYEAVFKEFFII